MIPTQSQIRDALDKLDDHILGYDIKTNVDKYCCYLNKEEFDTIKSLLQSALSQKPAGDAAMSKLNHLHNVVAYGIDHATQAQERQTIIDRLVGICERIIPLVDDLKQSLTGDCGGGDLEADTKKVIHLLDNGWKPVFNPPYEDTKYSLNKLPEGIISSAGFEKLSFEDAVTVQRCLEKVALTADNAKRGE